MVRVPTPATQGPQELGGVQTVAADTPFQQTQLPDLSFNARQLGRIGEALGNVAAEFGRRENETVMLEAQQDINDWRNGVFNPEDGVLRQEGGNAIGATERTINNAEEFSSLMEQRYGSRLTASGRAALRTKLQQETQSVATRVVSHETSQRRQYEVSLLDANIEDALDQIKLNPTNDEVFNQNVGRILTSTSQASSISGETGTELGTPAANRQQEALTAAVGARVATLAGPTFKQPGEALRLLEEYSDEIDPDTYAELYPQIREAHINKRALTRSETARAIDMTGLPPVYTPQAGNLSSAGAETIDYKGMPLAVTAGKNPLIGTTEGASRMTNPDAAITMDEMLRGPFMELQRASERTLVIRDAIAKSGTSRETQTPGSQHFEGTALDIDITDMSYPERIALVRQALQLGFRGIGFGKGTLHLDMRQTDAPQAWTYSGHESGWNGKSEDELKRTISDMQLGQYIPTQATGADYINSIADPEIRNRAQEAYSADVRFRDGMKSRENAQLLNDIYSQVEIDYQAQQSGTGNLGDVSEYLSPEAISQLGTDAASVRRYINQVRSGAERVTDQSTYNELFTRATSPYPEVRSAFANDPGALLAAKPNLSVQDFRSLQTMQQSMRAEIAGQEAENEPARRVNRVMAEANAARINNVVPDIIAGYSNMAGRVDDEEMAGLTARVTDAATRIIRPQLQGQLSNLSAAEIQRIEENPTLLDKRIANIARQLMQDVDVPELPDYDQASFLELVATADSEEGLTLDQMLSVRGDSVLTVPVPGLAAPLQITRDEIDEVVTQMTRDSGGIPPSPSRVIEMAYTAVRLADVNHPELMTPAGRQNLALMFTAQEDVEGQLEGENAPGEPEPAPFRPTGLGPIYEPPEAQPDVDPPLGPETVFTPQPMKSTQLQQSLDAWRSQTDAGAEDLRLPPETAFSYLQHMRQQLALQPGQMYTLTEQQRSALLQAAPMHSTYSQSKQNTILQGLAGLGGVAGGFGANQRSAIEELLTIYRESIAP